MEENEAFTYLTYCFISQFNEKILKVIFNVHGILLADHGELLLLRCLVKKLIRTHILINNENTTT